MTKMLRLIKNEFIKLSKRRVLAVMLALTLVAAICVALIFNLSVPKDELSAEEKIIEEWKHEIKRLEIHFAEDHYIAGNYADNSMRAKQFRNRSEMLQYLVDGGISPFDWRYTSGLVDKMFYAKLQMDIGYEVDRHKAEYEKLKKMADADDWKTYISMVADQNKAAYLERYPMAKDEVVAATSFEYEYRMEKELKPGEELWRDEMIASVVEAKLSMAYLAQQEYSLNTPGYVNPSSGDPALDKPNLGSLEEVEAGRAAVNDKLAVAMYRLEKNVAVDLGYIFVGETVLPFGENSLFWESFSASDDFIFIIGILIIVTAGLIVSSEFASGTIKFLLVSPVKRWKIVISKYVTVMSIALGLTAMLYVSSALASLLLFGGHGFGDVIVGVSEGVAYGQSPFVRVLVDYCWAFIEVVVVATMAFALSSLFRSTAVSVGIGVFAYLSGSVIVEIMAAANMDFGRYILFANIDLPSVIARQSLFPNQTVIGAVVNIVIHTVVFVMIAWDGFVRREI